MKNLLMITSVAASLLGASGCGEVDQAFDCDEICDIQRGCVANLDYDECFQSCEDLPDDDADRCDNCLSSSTCMDCEAECDGLVLEPS